MNNYQKGLHVQAGFAPIQIILSILAGTLVLGGIIGGVLYFAKQYDPVANNNPKYICNFSGYKKIKNGMTKDDIKNIIGTPLYVNDYSSNDRNIAETWEYGYYNGIDQFPALEGNFNIMFNDNIVTGKSCGLV